MNQSPQKLTDLGELDEIRDFYFMGDPRGGDGLEEDDRSERIVARRKNSKNQAR